MAEKCFATTKTKRKTSVKAQAQHSCTPSNTSTKGKTPFTLLYFYQYSKTLFSKTHI